MKFNMIVAVLLIAGAVYFWTGGGSTLGFQSTRDLPETIVPPNATFLGKERSNPFFTQ